jgi:hypothetical protein
MAETSQMQTSVGGRKLNAQNNGGQDEQRAKLVTRLADDRRGAFAVASATGVHEDATRVVRFGPVTDGRGFYLLDKDFAHAFVVPEQGRVLEHTLAKHPAERYADALSYLAAQRASRDRASGEFESFGRMPSSLAGRAFSDQGIESAWDIRVLDENGQVSELLQAKATESVGCVKEALLRYPDTSCVAGDPRVQAILVEQNRPSIGANTTDIFFPVFALVRKMFTFIHAARSLLFRLLD